MLQKTVLFANYLKTQSAHLFWEDSVHKRPSLRFEKNVGTITVARTMLTLMLNAVPESFLSNLHKEQKFDSA